MSIRLAADIKAGCRRPCYIKFANDESSTFQLQEFLFMILRIYGF